MRLATALFAGALFAQDKPPEKVKLPTSPEDLARGKKLYLSGCTYCHGPTGDGGKGANLARPELARAKNDDDLVRIVEVGIPGTEMPGAWHMTRREVTQTAAFVRTLGKVEIKPVPGDPVRGKAIYDRAGCAACHTIKEGNAWVGGFSGPDLAGIGMRRSASHLRESIVAPEASLPEDYQPVRVTMKDGRKMEGQRLREDTFNLALRDPAGNNHVIRKANVKEVVTERKKSPMPAFQDKLSEAELTDLVAYMVSLREEI